MNSYFDHPFISNSDLKSFKKKMGIGREDPPNLQRVFEFGTLFHQTILEPNQVNKTVMDDDMVLAQKMKATFFKDELCRTIVMRHDFEREKEFYKTIQVGGMEYNARCKADGYSKGIGLFVELKGLSVDNEKAFNEAIDQLDYDEGIVHYMLTSECKMCLIPAISKRKPDRMFKKIVKKHDEFYLMGEHKLINTLTMLRQVSPEDVRLVA